MRKKSFPVTSIGTTSLMMIFIVLCMVTFAALSLSSAIHDKRLGEKLSGHTGEYYAACSEAAEILAAGDALFARAFAGTKSETEYFRFIARELPDTVETSPTEEGLRASFLVPVNDSQALSVTLLIPSPEQLRAQKAESYYRILAFQEIHTDDWEGDNTMNLLRLN